MNKNYSKTVKHRPSYNELEHHENIKTNVADKDLLKLHIDMALDDGNEALFLELTNKLKALKEGAK